MSTEVSERVPLVSALGGTELGALLHPVTPETFVHEYWGQKPLFVKGFPDKYRGLFDREAFVKALTAGPAPPDFLHASFDKKGGDPMLGAPGAPKDMPATVFSVSPEQAAALYAGGATLCATQLESRTPSLAPFVAAIKRQLGYPGKVTFNAYLSPAGSGFNWHFDMRIASTFQIDGTKRWRYSNRPCVPWPQANGVLRTDGSGSPAPLLPKLGGRPGEVDPHALDAINRQLAKAAAAVGSVGADSATVVRLWTSFVQNANPASTSVAAAPPSPILAGDRLRVRSDGNVYVRTADQSTKLFVSVGAAGLAVGGTAVPFLQRLLSVGEFVAGDAVQWVHEGKPLTWREVEATLNHFLREGLLERVHS